MEQKQSRFWSTPKLCISFTNFFEFQLPYFKNSDKKSIFRVVLKTELMCLPSTLPDIQKVLNELVSFLSIRRYFNFKEL